MTAYHTKTVMINAKSEEQQSLTMRDNNKRPAPYIIIVVLRGAACLNMYNKIKHVHVCVYVCVCNDLPVNDTNHKITKIH